MLRLTFVQDHDPQCELGLQWELSATWDESDFSGGDSVFRSQRADAS